MKENAHLCGRLLTTPVLGPLVNVRAVQFPPAGVTWKKKMYNLETRGLFYLMYKNDDLSLPCSLSALRDHSKEIRPGPEI